uniref:Uncharacterized protein n=1 Tax=Astatotilapia calliptera TaxID=8154 RepID=A0A3P8N7R8_ASTCA
MGCNLCTLQKREEHYKLLYEIAQVNGKELSKSSHEETVEAFRPAKDPVVVQVIRRTPSGRPHGPPQEIHVVDVCTQTDITFEHIMALAKLRPSTPPVPDVCPFLLSDRFQLRQKQLSPVTVKLRKSILLTPKSPPLSVSLAPCPSLLTAVIPFIQWTRITTKGLTTSPLYPLMETGQRSLSMRK